MGSKSLGKSHLIELIILKSSFQKSTRTRILCLKLKLKGSIRHFIVLSHYLTLFMINGRMKRINGYKKSSKKERNSMLNVEVRTQSNLAKPVIAMILFTTLIETGGFLTENTGVKNTNCEIDIPSGKRESRCENTMRIRKRKGRSC